MWLDKKINSNVQHANTSATEQPVLENKQKKKNTYMYLMCGVTEIFMQRNGRH